MTDYWTFFDHYGPGSFTVPNDPACPGYEDVIQLKGSSTAGTPYSDDLSFLYMDEFVITASVKGGQIDLESGEHLTMEIVIRTDNHFQTWSGYSLGINERGGHWDSYAGVRVIDEKP